MGSNIGITVTTDGDGPKGDNEQLENQFFVWLHTQFPQGGFGRGWVKHSQVYDSSSWGKRDVYDFDVRIFAYSSEFGDPQPMYLAIFRFVLEHFNYYEDNITCEPYYSG